MNARAYLREPEIIFWMLIFPAAIAGVLGVAFSETETPELPVAVVVDADAPWLEAIRERVERSREITQTPAAKIELLSMTQEQAVQALRRGRVQLYITRSDSAGAADRSSQSKATSRTISQAEPSAEAQALGGPEFRAHFDPRNPEARLAWLALDRALQMAPPEDPGRSAEAGRVASVEAAPIEQTGSRYIDFLIPGLLALGVMNSCMWGIGYGLIDLRVKKFLRRMAASPMYKSAFLASRFLTRLAFSLLEFLLLFVFATFFFNVQVQGSWIELGLLFVSGNFAWSGIAVFCSSRARSVNSANGIINAVTLPMTILSGIFFSYRNFPEWSQAVIEYLPLTILADAMRAVMTEGATLFQSAPAIAVLFVTGVVFFGIGLRIYKWH